MSEKHEDFWAMVKRVAAQTKGRPQWEGAGINLCHTRYQVDGGGPCPYQCCAKQPRLDR